MYNQSISASLQMRKISRIKPVEEDSQDTYTDDESSVHIIFRVLAGLCDGQNKPLQVFLRIQS